MATQNTKVYFDEEGDKLVVASGGTLQIDSGATMSMSGTQEFDDIVGNDASLGITGKAGSAGAGGIVAVTGGAGDATGAGGAVTVTGGASGAGATGNGGRAGLVGGAASSTNGNGGDAVLTGGVATGTGTGGAVNLTSGASAGAGGTAGSIAIDTGAASGGTGGTITIGGTNATAVSVGRSGQTVNIKGAALSASSGELNTLDGAPMGTPTFVVGAEGGNVINVAIQLKDGDAADLAIRGSVMAYLSNDANGDSIATNAPNTGVAIGTDGLLIPIPRNLSDAVFVNGALAISGGDATKFKTTAIALITVNGVGVTKAATDNLTFTAAHVISANKFGVILIQMNAAGTISTKVPLATQAYNDAPTALAALPTADAGNVALGYIAIENNAGDWTANTDDLTNGSDVTTAAFTDTTVSTMSSVPKAFYLTSESDGDIDINISETGVVTWYLVVVLPNGKLAASGAIAFT